MRPLIFTCGYEDCYFQFANWFAHTVRYYGYQGDLVIFSSQDRVSPYAQVINVAPHPDVDLLKTGKRRYFHSNIPRDFGYEYYRKPWDFFMIKTLPGAFINRDQYDFILYCDSDILARKCLNPVFESPTIVTAFNSRALYYDIKGLVNLLKPDEIEPAKMLQGSGGGVVGVPRTMYDFYDEYRKTYLETINLIPHDQPALSLTLFRNRDRYKSIHLDQSFLSHYWGKSGRKQRLVLGYQDFLKSTGETAVTI